MSLLPVKMRCSLLSPLVVLSALICKSSEFVQCFYPDGSIPTDYVWVPCTNDAVSSCCIPSEGDICQDNGLCYFPPYNALFRGACTDQTWTSNLCPKLCITGFESTWSWSTPCIDGTYGCGGHDESSATCAAGVLTTFPVQTISTPLSVPTETVVETTTAITSPTSPTRTTPISSLSTSSSSKAALTPGAIAGIAAGPTVALLVGLAILYVIRRNQKKKQDSSQRLSNDSGTKKFPTMYLPLSPTAPPPAYPNSPMKQDDQIYTAEIDGRPSQQQIAEIDGRPVMEK